MDHAAGTERIVGRYVLCDEIAAGGMATVHFGRLLGPVGFARIVAIKRLHSHFAKDPEFVAMLLDEARLAARIRHPNVVSTLDVVVEKGELLVVMDYVQGESLARLARSVVRAGERIPLGVVMSTMSGALYGLHAAHEATNDQGQALGIVHRDVSPQNILVGVDGVARVLDFGVAKAGGRIQTTREGTLKGKIAYMSPEQVCGETLDRRSDIYAAAVVLWELLCTRRLFQGDNEAATIRAVMSGQVLSPREIFPDVPTEVEAVVMKGLAAKADDRFATAWEMAEALQRIAYATPGDVAAWVRHYGAKSLAEREARIAEIESNSHADFVPQQAASNAKTASLHAVDAEPKPRLSAPIIGAVARSFVPPTTPASDGAAHSQITDFSGATPRASARATRSPWPVVAALAALVAAVAVVLGVAMRRGSAPSTPTVAALAPASVVPIASTAPPTVVTPVVPSSSVISTLAPAAPTKSGTVRPRAHVRASSHPKSKCNPPYTINAEGIRVPKPECL